MPTNQQTLINFSCLIRKLKCLRTQNETTNARQQRISVTDAAQNTIQIFAMCILL